MFEITQIIERHLQTLKNAKFDNDPVVFESVKSNLLDTIQVWTKKHVQASSTNNLKIFQSPTPRRTPHTKRFYCIEPADADKSIDTSKLLPLQPYEPDSNNQLSVSISYNFRKQHIRVDERMLETILGWSPDELFIYPILPVADFKTIRSICDQAPIKRFKSETWVAHKNSSEILCEIVYSKPNDDFYFLTITPIITIKKTYPPENYFRIMHSEKYNNIYLKLYPLQTTNFSFIHLYTALDSTAKKLKGSHTLIIDIRGAQSNLPANLRKEILKTIYTLLENHGLSYVIKIFNNDPTPTEEFFDYPKNIPSTCALNISEALSKVPLTQKEYTTIGKLAC